MTEQPKLLVDHAALQAECLLLKTGTHSDLPKDRIARTIAAARNAPNVDVLRHFLSIGVDPHFITPMELMDPNGRWRRLKHTALLSCLYEAGRDPNRVWPLTGGYSDLHAAVRTGCAHAIRFCVDHGARGDVVPAEFARANTPWATAMTTGAWPAADSILSLGVHWGAEASDRIITSIDRALLPSRCPAPVLSRVWSAVVQHDTWNDPAVQEHVQACRLKYNTTNAPSPSAQAFWGGVDGHPIAARPSPEDIRAARAQRKKTSGLPIDHPKLERKALEDCGALTSTGAVMPLVDLRARNALRTAVERGNAAAVRALLRAGVHPDDATTDKGGVLSLACVRGDIPTVQALLSARATRLTSPESGQTDLMDFIQRGCGHMVLSRCTTTLANALRIIAKGADINAKTHTTFGGIPMGTTALHMMVATRMNHPEHLAAGVGVLLELGADPRLKNTLGKTALDILNARSIMGQLAATRDLLTEAMLSWDRHELNAALTPAQPSVSKRRM